MENKGTVIAIIIIFLSLAVLMVSCGTAVGKDVGKEIQDIEKKLVKVEDAKVLAENEEKLVLVSGKAEREKIVTDDEFKVSTEGTKLVRKVEMYQWVEYETWNSETSEDEYDYDLIWSDSLLEDTYFEYRDTLFSEKHINPDTMPYENITFYNPIKIGDFELSKEQIEKIPTTGVYTDLSEEVASSMRITSKWTILYKCCRFISKAWRYKN